MPRAGPQGVPARRCGDARGGADRLDGSDIDGEGGSGTQEKNAATITIEYWPAVLPTHQIPEAPVGGTFQDDGYI